MEAEGSGVIFPREEWIYLKSKGKVQFIVESISMNILLMLFLSMIINIIVKLLYKIKPELYIIILIFIIQPLILAILYSFITIKNIYRLNFVIYEQKQKDKKYYKKYFIIDRISLNFILTFTLVINIYTISNFNILELMGLFIGISVVSVLRDLKERKERFNKLYEEIIEKINQDENEFEL